MKHDHKAARLCAWLVVLALLCSGVMTALAERYVCPICNGATTCSTCGGSGQVNCGTCGGMGFWRVGETCPNCSGRGKVTCTTCSGTGTSNCWFCGGKGYYESGSGGSGDDSGGGSSTFDDDDGGNSGGTVVIPGRDDGNVPYSTAKGKVLACTEASSADCGVKKLFDGDESTTYRTPSTELYVIWKAPRPIGVTGYAFSFGYLQAQADGDTPKNVRLYGSEKALGRSDSGWQEIVNETVDIYNIGFSSDSDDVKGVYQYFKLEIGSNYGGPSTRITEVTIKGKEINVPATVKGLNYKLDNINDTATFIGPKDKNIKEITIPSVIKVNGKTYFVTSVKASACKALKKLAKLSIGKNVTDIGKYAFAECPKLKTVTGGKYVETIGEAAFMNDVVLAEITLYSKVSKIGRKAWYGCKKAKTVTIKTKKLTTSNVGAYAFKNLYATATVTCPAAKLKAYKALLPKKGMGKKVTYQ